MISADLHYSMPALMCAPSSGRAGLAGMASDNLLTRVHEWLECVGLGKTNPFAELEAGADPHLSRYLVRHDVFDLLWQDAPTIVYAPAGGGKSAFRVRLAWACRVGEDGRHVFAIPYLAPDPKATTLAAHLDHILRRAARELFLALAYRPACFLDLDEGNRLAVRRVLDQNSPGLVRRFLPQLRRAGTFVPLVEGFDASAGRLTDPPDPDEIQTLCSVLAETPESRDVPPADQRFESLLAVLRHVLGFESVYLLVDGIDAWPKNHRHPEQVSAVLLPLLAQTTAWVSRELYLKLFLPLELRTVLPRELTKNAQSAIIRWDPGSLAEVLHRRLAAASGGRFDSLDALSAPSLNAAEEELLRAIRSSPVPRELLVLVNRVIEEHVRTNGQKSQLEQQDVRAAIRWYRTRSKRSSL